MLFNNRFFLLYILGGILLFSCASTKKETNKSIPLWADAQTIYQFFPQEKYIACVGYGNTEENARLNSDAELASYFNHSVSVQTCAIETLKNNYKTTDITRSIEREIQISSQTDFVALHHTEPYFINSTNKYIVCAYIEKKEAWEILEPKLISEASAIESAYKKSQIEKELFQRIILLNEVQNHSKYFYDIYYQVVAILPEEAIHFSKYDGIIQTVQIELKKLKPEASISIKIQDDKTNRIKTKLYEVFSKEGFSIVTGAALYSIDVLIECEISEKGEAFVSYPNISILIKKNNGKTISSWAKQIPKVAAYTKEACERMVLNKIEKELDSVFINEVLNNRSFQ